MTAVASSPMKPYILSHNPDQRAMAVVNSLSPGCIVSSYGDEYFVDRIYRKDGREINLIGGSQDRGFSWDKFVPKGKGRRLRSSPSPMVLKTRTGDRQRLRC